MPENNGREAPLDARQGPQEQTNQTPQEVVEGILREAGLVQQGPPRSSAAPNRGGDSSYPT